MCTCSRENIIIVRCDINRVFHACLLITLLLSLSQLIILGIVAWRAKLVREPSVNTLRRVVHCLALIDEQSLTAHFTRYRYIFSSFKIADYHRRGSLQHHLLLIAREWVVAQTLRWSHRCVPAVKNGSLLLQGPFSDRLTHLIIRILALSFNLLPISAV